MQQYITERLPYQVLIPPGDRNKAQPFQLAILSVELSELGGITLCFAIRAVSCHAVIDVIITYAVSTEIFLLLSHL